MRSGYWWSFAAIGALTPFIAPYYEQLGFSGARIGVLVALPAVAVAFLAPVWGAVSDSLSLHRLVLRVALLLTALASLALTQAASFAPMLALVALLAFFNAPVPSLMDSYGVAISERSGKSYGSLRVWGSLGYMASVFVLGRLMGEDVTRLFLVAYAAFLLLACLSTLGLPRLAGQAAGPLWGSVRAVARNRPLLALLLTTYLISSGAAAMYNYLGIHLGRLGAGSELLGDAFALSAASELPVLFFGARLLARLGASRLMGLAIAVFVVRLAAYGALPSPVWVLPVQLLHGLSFGAFLMASVTLVHGLSGRGLAATAQGLLTSMSFGFGSITGSLVGGVLLDRIGTVGLFRVAAAVMLLALGVYVASARALGIGATRSG